MAMADTSNVPIPMHDALRRVKREAAILSSFLDFLEDKGYLSEEAEDDFNQIIGKHLEINPDELAAEKDALLDTINLPEGEYVVPEHAKHLVKEGTAD